MIDPFSRRLPLLLDRLALAVLLALAAWLSLALARAPDSVAAIWIGNGVFVGWLLSRPTAQWSGYVVAGFAAEFLVRRWFDPLLPALVLSASDLVEVLIVAGAVRRRVPDVGHPRGWLELGGIATGSTLAACAISGLGAAGMIMAAAGDAFVPTFLTWYSGHVVGMALVATFTLFARRGGIGISALEGGRWDFFGCMLLLAVVSTAVFAQSTYPLLFLTYPPLLLAAFRHRFAGVIVGVTLLAVIGSIATSLGDGPLVMMQADHLSSSDRIVLLQLFVGAGCVMTFPVALTMAQRGRMVAQMRESEARYRLLADYSHDMVLRVRADGTPLYVSPSSRQLLGWEPEELLALDPELDIVHPEDRVARQQAIDEVLATGQPGSAIYRVQHRDGHYLWVESVFRTIPNAAGDGVDVILAARDISRRMAAEQALQASHRELESLARSDSLTGLANRRQFDERLALALLRSQRHGSPIALMYMDIDHFKQINDGHGHAAGDEALRMFARRLVACVRAGDLVARLGGDEFVVMIDDAALPEAAEIIARKLLTAMSVPIDVGTATITATTSIGIAYCPGNAVAGSLSAAADAALYAAKRAGRNTYRMLTVDGVPTWTAGT